MQTSKFCLGFNSRPPSMEPVLFPEENIHIKSQTVQRISLSDLLKRSLNSHIHINSLSAILHRGCNLFRQMETDSIMSTKRNQTLFQQKKKKKRKIKSNNISEVMAVLKRVHAIRFIYFPVQGYNETNQKTSRQINPPLKTLSHQFATPII